MVYLNKGQFYPITLQGVDSRACHAATKVKVSHGNRVAVFTAVSYGKNKSVVCCSWKHFSRQAFFTDALLNK